MLNLSCLGKELETKEMPKRLLHAWAGLGRDKAFLVLCRNRGSLCCYMVLWFQTVAMLRHSLSMSRHKFCFSVATEVSLSRSRRSRQEVKRCDFHVTMGLVLAGGFVGRDRTFLVATKNYQE